MLDAPASSKRPLSADWFALLLFSGLAIVVLLTFRDYGYSWDEVWQGRWYGQAVLNFISSLGEDQRATYENNFYLYGGTHDVLAELLAAFSPLEPRNARHLSNAVAGLVGLAGCWRLARLMGGARAGFWAVLFLSACAPFYGHMFINAKDIPFAAGYVWSLYFLVKVCVAYPSPLFRDRLLLGLSAGLMLGVRIGGVMILLYYALSEVVHLCAGLLHKNEALKSGSSLTGVFLRALLVVVVAWPLMLACWPAALLSPIKIPMEAFRAASHFDWIGLVLWNGRELWSNDLPWSYIPVVLGVQIPEVLALLFCSAIVWGVIRWGVSLRRQESALAHGLGLLLIAVLFPVSWAIYIDAVLYDNARQFLFVLPPLACLAAMCWVALLDFSGGLSKWARWGLQGFMVFGLVVSAGQMSALHPYEYTYLNRFAGGIPGGGERFETDYWITSYREAAFKLLRHAESVAFTEGVPFQSRRFTVSMVGPPETLLEMLPGNMLVGQFNPNRRTDYLIATTRWNADEFWPDWPIVDTVGRSGMTFAVLRCSPSLAALVPP